MEMFFDDKSSISHYGLGLKSCVITPPKRKRYLVNVPGGDGSIDLAEGMGPARYEPRTVTAVFCPLSGDLHTTVDVLLNELEGRTVDFSLPGDRDHYMTGAVHIMAARNSSAKSSGEITITVNCMPWRYAVQEVVHQIPASAVEVQYTWDNHGGRDAVPTVVVSSDVLIVFGTSSMAMTAGTYQLATLTIPHHDSITVKISGGPIEVRYREADL